MILKTVLKMWRFAEGWLLELEAGHSISNTFLT